MRGLIGTFSVMPLVDVVRVLARRRATGTLSCERGTVRKLVHLREGTAVAADSNDPREHLGQLLLVHGHLDEEQLTRAFRSQVETRTRLGKLLVSAGLVAPETLRAMLAVQVREALLDAIQWDAGAFWVDDGEPPATDELAASVPLDGIPAEAEQRATAWNAYRREFPSGADALAVDEARVPEWARPDTPDGRVLALPRDGRTLDEIGLALHATEFHLLERLHALAREGAVRAVPAAVRPADEASPSDLVAQGRALLDGGRASDAERLAARAVAIAPAADSARALLADAERVLSERLRVDLPRKPRLRITAAELARLPLASQDKYLLSRCDGNRDVRELAQVAPLRELDVLKAVRRLADEGLLELS
jgi:Domain of unknown function (DUF4388)